MRRVLAILRLLFAHHWSVALMLGMAVLFLVIGVFDGPGFVTGNIFTVFGILWASTAFRQFASNGRLSMLPGFRTHAVAALFLVAVAVGAAAGLAAVLNPEPAAAAGPVGTALLAFALVSAGCLFSQWSSTSRAPVLLQLLLLLLVLRYVVSGSLYESRLAGNAWVPALATLLGWGWLLVALQRNARLAGPHPLLRIEHTSGINPGQWTLDGMFGFGPLNLGRPSRAGGTLMRGGNDGWVNRIGTSLFLVLGIALLGMLMHGMDAFSGWRARHTTDPTLVFLTVSFVFTAVQAPARFFDWPARLRYVWLRTPGDRAGLWRMLDRTIGAEALIVAAITTVVSAVLFLAAGTAIGLLLTYVLGSTVAVLLGAYGAMGMRISGASVTAINACVGLGWLPLLLMMMAVGPEPAALNRLLFAIGALTVISRYAARRRFMRMDWCAVKPWRSQFAGASPGARS